MNHFLDAVAAPRFLEDLLATRNDDVVLHRMATRLREAYGKKDSSKNIYWSDKCSIIYKVFFRCLLSACGFKDRYIEDSC